jgi:CelD/BcsL family acetyltransferase involved in cellulose biosynthesis
MAKVSLIDPLQDPRWDVFVEKHSFGLICHTSGWKQVLEKSFKQMKGYYFVLSEDESDSIRAALPVFEVKSWLTGKRLISMPFASLCDPLISSKQEMDDLLNEVIERSQELNSSFIEIRTLASSSLTENDRLAVTKGYIHHFLVLDSDPEKLRSKFHRTCVRQRIARAEKSDLRLKVADNESDMREFYQLHSMTRRRLGLPVQPFVFFKSLWEGFSPSKRLTLLLAVKNGHAMGAIILFKFRDRVSAEFAASDESFANLSPNHFLFWEAIKLAYEQGYRIFDFGRTSSSNESLLDFKRRWGTEVVDLPCFVCPKDAAPRITNREESRGYKLAQFITAKTPDFAQHYIGKLIYRHMG